VLHRSTDKFVPARAALNEVAEKLHSLASAPEGAIEFARTYGIAEAMP